MCTVKPIQHKLSVKPCLSVLLKYSSGLCQHKTVPEGQLWILSATAKDCWHVQCMNSWYTVALIGWLWYIWKWALCDVVCVVHRVLMMSQENRWSRETMTVLKLCPGDSRTTRDRHNRFWSITGTVQEPERFYTRVFFMIYVEWKNSITHTEENV